MAELTSIIYAESLLDVCEEMGNTDKIAGELEVAATTIKTHIRNLYQKLGVAHRQDAVQHAQQLLKMMGYGV